MRRLIIPSTTSKKFSKSSDLCESPFSVHDTDVPRHIAIIPDGNARWSRNNALTIGQGHSRGVEVIEEILDYCQEIGVLSTTVYAFSTENWDRPQKEKIILFDLIEDFFTLKIPKIIEKKARIKIVGKIKRFPERVQKVLIQSEEKSSKNNDFLIQIALDYGGRDEIIRAAKKFATDVREGKADLDKLSEDGFSNYLDTHLSDDPDLLIRTGDTFRISNFLLYQMSYTEFYFTHTLWPDFSIQELKKAINEYIQRDRRYGRRS